MNLPRLILREIQHTRWNTLLCLVTVLAAVMILVTMVTVNRASVDSMRVLMKEMGFNLLITPPGTDLSRYQALDFQDIEMPEEYVRRMANSTILARHFVGKYQQTIQLHGRMVVLTGVLPQASESGKKKPMPTAYRVPRGHVYLGSAAAGALDLEPGDSLEIMGRSFNVGRVLDQVGVMPEDIRVFAQLHDVQELLGREGKINAIDALSCQCPVSAEDLVAALTAGIHEVIPGVEVQPYHSILLTRHQSRKMISTLATVTLALVLVVAALAIWGLTFMNVRNRRREIGVYRALGLPDLRIAMLFVGKIIIYSWVGAVLGCILGYVLALELNMAGVPVKRSWDLITGLVIGTPLATILFGLGPVLSALMQETNDLMREKAG